MLIHTPALCIDEESYFFAKKHQNFWAYNGPCFFSTLRHGQCQNGEGGKKDERDRGKRFLDHHNECQQSVAAERLVKRNSLFYSSST